MAVPQGLVRDAIDERRIVRLRYQGDGSEREVWPHIMYRTSKGTVCVDCYQIAGPTHGRLPDWRPFNLMKIVTFDAEQWRFEVAPDYNSASPKYRHGVLARGR